MKNEIPKASGSRRRAGRPSSSDRADRRQDIFDAAIRLFSHNGFSRVDLGQIAKEAGVTSALVRHYFGNKDQLVDATTAQVISRLELVYQTILSEIKISSVDELLALLYKKNEVHLVPNYDLLYFLKQLIVEMPEKSFPLFRKHFMLMQSQFSGLQAIGQIQPGVNTVWFIFMLISIQLGPIFLEKQIEDIIGLSPRDPDATRMRNESNRQAVTFGILPR